MSPEEAIQRAEYKYDVVLKDFQRHCAVNAPKGQDCFVNIPTGSGKTFCYVLIAAAYNELLGVDNSVVLVVSPLISLMSDQAKRLQDLQIKAAFVGQAQTDNAVKIAVQAGEISVVFVSPEALNSSYWRSVLMSDTYRDRIRTVVIDEAHCISEWGDDFRPDYRQLGDIRAILPAEVPFIALTATATQHIRRDVETSLHMANPILIHRSPDRANIFFSVEKTSPGDFSCLNWLLQRLNHEGASMPKTVVYCRNVPSVAQLYGAFMDDLGGKAYKNGEKAMANCYIAMFHRGTAELNKKHVLEVFTKEDSTVRLVFATSAFGMGVDIPDIQVVVHYGCPRSLEMYMQQSGRAGRNGNQAFCITYYQSLTTTKKTTSNAMASLLKGNTCRRNAFLHHFRLSGTTYDEFSKGMDKQLCCDVCEAALENRLDKPWDKVHHLSSSSLGCASEAVIREVDMNFIDLLRANLLEYIEEDPVFLTCNIPFLVDSLIHNCIFFLTYEDVIEETGIENIDVCKTLLELVDEVFPLSSDKC